MSYDYIPQTDYSLSRAERRRKEKESFGRMFKGKGDRKIAPARRGPNRAMRRSRPGSDTTKPVHVDYDQF